MRSMVEGFIFTEYRIFERFIIITESLRQHPPFTLARQTKILLAHDIKLCYNINEVKDMKQLICVEDDADIRELIAYTLSNYGFAVTGCESASEFYKASSASVPDLILLDIMLPDTDGMTILRGIRSDARLKRVPVILLTAKTSQVDKIRGLDGGADDYITKPFDIMELISRVKALLRRAAPQSGETMEFHGLTVDPESREVSLGNDTIPLTYKEFELLYILVQNSGRAVTRASLMDHVWGIGFEGESRTLDVHIRTLRQKLGEHGKYIETVRGVGYKAV